jgi:CheY-like chemotaxis protein
MNDTPAAILYVENDPRSRKVMRLMIGTLERYDLHIFEDSQDFMQRVIALNPPPSLILLDIHVDPHDGFEMMAMLRQSDLFQQTPIVAVTASVMNEELAKLRTVGFSGCLAKPLDIDTFPDSLNHLLNGEAVWRITG